MAISVPLCLPLGRSESLFDGVFEYAKPFQQEGDIELVIDKLLRLLDPPLETVLFAATAAEELGQPAFPFHLGLEQPILFDSTAPVFNFAAIAIAIAIGPLFTLSVFHICHCLSDFDRGLTCNQECDQGRPIHPKEHTIETSETPKQLEQSVVYPLDIDSLVIDLVADRVEHIV